MNIEAIKPYPKNAKKHPNKQVEQIAASIKEFGFNQPIVVDSNNVVIVGHGRLEAAILLGLKEVPTITVDLTEDQAKAYRLADNKLNESDWDMNLVIEELKGLSEPMFELTGFDKDLILESDEKDDIVPENSPPVAKTGDLWALGRHRLYCGDSTNIEAVKALMGDMKADMVFTDPPYNVNYEGSTGLKIENDNKSDTEFYKFLYDSFTNYAAVLKAGGAIYVCHADLEGLNFREAFNDAGFSLKSSIIWNKNTLVMGRGDYQWKHEPILYGWQEGATHTWFGDRKQTTVWDMQRPSKSSDHPTMKPVELITKAIINSSKSEDIVLDLFGGSGSTLIAAEKTNRICMMSELDEKYVDVIIKRYEEYTGNKAEKISG